MMSRMVRARAAMRFARSSGLPTIGGSCARKALNMVAHLRLPIAVGAQLAGVSDVGEAAACLLLAVVVPAELQVVGEDQVAQALAVAPELLVALDLIQRAAHILGLDVADGSSLRVTM